MVLFLTGGLDPGDQICLCRADFLLYREENAALVLAVVLLRYRRKSALQRQI